MSEIVERVARAILSKRFGGGAEWDRESEVFRDACRIQARAAISAMREPTIAQIGAVMKAEGGFSNPATVRSHYTMMIDEALKPSDPSPPAA